MTNKCVEFFKALSDENRQRIIELLENKDMCVSEIVDCCGLSQPTISHHLNILKNVGLVAAKKKGQQTYYSLNKNWFKECCKDYLSMFDCCKDLFEGCKNTKDSFSK